MLPTFLILQLATLLPQCPAARASCMEMQLWLTEADEGKLGWIRAQLEAANERLAVIDAGVQVTEVHRLPADETNIVDRHQRDRLGQHGKQTPLRWLVVERLEDLEERGKLRKGVTWRQGDGFYIIEAVDAWAPTLAHELGHVLGLPHSTEAASLMNKSVRAWPPYWKWGFTAREQPRMRATLARLIRNRRLVVQARP